MDFLYTLILAVSMFLGSMLFGNLPLFFKLSDSKLKLIGSLACGLLLSTALSIIIPESTHSLHSNEQLFGLLLLLGFTILLTIDHFSHSEHSMTWGMYIHCLADGLALAASLESTNDPQLAYLIFFAILLHKAPSAFALCSLLLKQKQTIWEIRKKVLIFCAVAPVGCLLGSLILQFLLVQHEEISFYTGVLLSLSAGSFLYISIHALQDLTHPLDQSNFSLLLLGLLIPPLINQNHHH